MLVAMEDMLYLLVLARILRRDCALSTKALEVVLYALEMLEGMRCVLLCMLEAVEGGFCLLEAMRCMLLCMLEAVEGGCCVSGVVGCWMLRVLSAECGCGVWEGVWGWGGVG